MLLCCMSSGVLADELVFGLAEDIGHLGCLIVLPPQKPLPTVWVRVVSWHFLGTSTFFSIAPHQPLLPSYLVFSLSVLFHPSIFPPIHPPIHPFIHTSTHHPSIHPSTHPPTHSSRNEWVDEWKDGWMNGWLNGCVGEWTDGWMDDWMHGWMNVCVGWLLVVAWAYGRLSHARGPTAYRLTGFTPRQRPSRSTTNKQTTHTFNQPTMHPIIHPFHSTIRPYTHPHIHSPTHSFTNPFIHPPSVRPLIHPFAHTNNPSFIHPPV